MGRATAGTTPHTLPMDSPPHLSVYTQVKNQISRMAFIFIANQINQSFWTWSQIGLDVPLYLFIYAVHHLGITVFPRHTGLMVPANTQLVMSQTYCIVIIIISLCRLHNSFSPSIKKSGSGLKKNGCSNSNTASRAEFFLATACSY